MPTLYSFFQALLAVLLLLPAVGRALPAPLRRLPATALLDGGSSYSLLLRPDGTLYTWGNNYSGQLGNSTVGSALPMAVSQATLPAGTHLVQASAGEAHVVALATTGLAYSWGNNRYGQLGNNSTTDSAVPVAVALPAGVQLVQVAAAYNHTLALAADGTLWGWGNGGNGQLGTTGYSVPLAPIAIDLGGAPAGTRFVQVAAGQAFSMALSADGIVYTWGYNSDGQLGNSTTIGSAALTPVSQGAMPAGTRIVQVVAGYDNALALAADGTAYTWGHNSYGQLGTGTSTDSSVPVAVAMPAAVRFVKVTAGLNHLLALAADGTAYAWGRNSYGQLGTGTSTDSLVPVAVGPAGVELVQVAAGFSHSLALAADGALYSWGANDRGQLGTGTTVDSPTPIVALAPAPTGYQQVAGGAAYALGLRADGTVWAWGRNQYGELGTGTGLDSAVPVAVALPGGARAVQVAAGFAHSLALGADGTLYAWGSNSNGQLGTANTAVPVAVAAAGVRFVQIAAGYNHSLALAADGTLYAWGYNNNGQLGDNSTTDRAVPVPVNQSAIPPGTRFVQVVGGSECSMALGADGTAYIWGYNGSGGLGTGQSQISLLVPTAVIMPPGMRVVQVAAGAHAMALGADGTVYTWGYDYHGSLGNGVASGTTVTMPRSISQGAMPTGTRIVQVAASLYHSLGLAANGMLYTWGENAYGELGTNSTTSANVPVAEISGHTNWHGLSLTPVGSFSLVLGTEGAVFTSGQNNYGQLGDGTTTNALVFVRTPAPLPVRLLSFTAQASRPAAVQLTWATASEQGSAYFAIERSSDGVAFAEIGRVPAAGTSATAHTYAHLDAALPTGAGVLYYHLRQVDADGSVAYSPVRAVALAGAGLVLFPNPAAGGVTQLLGAAPGTVVQVFDRLGRLVLNTTADAAGQAQLLLPAQPAAGLYVVRAGSQALRLAVQ